MDNFNADIGITSLHRLFTLGPKETSKATAHLLNDEAFSFKELAPRILGEHLIIRNKAFVRSMFWVDKANPQMHPTQQKAIAGSLQKKHFSGWAELVTGQKPERNRLVGLNARGGSQGSQARNENRLMSGEAMIGPKDFADIPERSRIAAMLRMMAENPHYTGQSKGKFILDGGNWVKGVYKFRPGYQATYAKSKTKGVRIKGAKQRFNYLSQGIVRIQTMDKAPISRRLDWPTITIERVRLWVDVPDKWTRYFGDIVRKYNHI